MDDRRKQAHVRSLGYLYAFLDRLPAPGWTGLTDSERDGWSRCPLATLPRVMRRVMAARALDDAADADELAAIMDGVDPDGPGTTRRPLDSGQTGLMCMAAARYQPPRDGGMTPMDAAGRLGVTRARVYALLDSGGLLGVHGAGGWRVFPRSVEERARKMGAR